jgi:hypothetical protein
MENEGLEKFSKEIRAMLGKIFKLHCRGFARAERPIQCASK